MQFRKLARLASALLVAALTTLGTAAQAPRVAAQDLEPPIPVGPGEHLESWALSPVGDTPGEPGSRPTLTYSLPPGGSVEDAVTLWNYSSVPVYFRIVPTDAFNNAEGDFALLRFDKTPKDVGSWISIGSGAITVPAQTSVTVPVTLKVPDDASPGDHVGAVLAASDAVARDRQGNEVGLNRRTGPRVYLRVTGPIDPELVVEELGSKYQGRFNPLDGSLEVSYTVRNPGNVRVGAKQRIVVKDIFGRTVTTKKMPRIAEMLPGNAVEYSATVDGVPATVRVKTSVELVPIAAPGAAGEELPEATSAATHAWAIPWSVLLLLVLAYVLWRLSRRRRDSREEPPPAGRPREQIPEPVG